jgi:hypothetical protein
MHYIGMEVFIVKKKELISKVVVSSNDGKAFENLLQGLMNHNPPKAEWHPSLPIYLFVNLTKNSSNVLPDWHYPLCPRYFLMCSSLLQQHEFDWNHLTFWIFLNMSNGLMKRREGKLTEIPNEIVPCPYLRTQFYMHVCPLPFSFT